MFLLTHKSYLPSRIDFMNNIKEKANSLSEDEKAKIAPVLATSKFHSPILMTLLSIPFAIVFAIISAAIILVCLGFVDDFVIRKIFGSKWLDREFAAFFTLFLFACALVVYYKNTKAYNYNILMEILNGAIVDNSFLKAYFSIAFTSDKADADKLEEQNKPNEQQ